MSQPEVMQEMRRRVPNARTIPQIFMGDQFIGFDDLSHLLSGR